VPVSDAASHLVLSAIGSLTGIDPQSGEQLWKFEGISGNSTPTPAPLGHGRFLIGATIGREAGTSARAAESNGVIQITRAESGWKAEYLWHAKEATSSFGSPIAHAGRAYFVNQTGVLFCLNAETGDEFFHERLGGSIWATPFGSGRLLFLFQKNGTLQVYSAADKPQKIAEYPVFAQEENASSDPFAGKTLYGAIPCQSGFLIRSGSDLIRLAVKSNADGK
jgi:outer membrane protein assembly factor BamB